MKTKRTIALAIVLLAVAASAFAAPVIVTFVDGSAQVQSGSAWKKLDFDDKFDSALSVKLAVGAVLEIKAQNGSVVTIAAPGTYLVDSLFKPRTEQGTITTIAGKLEKLAKGGPQDSTVAGVRGAEAGQPAVTMWAGGTEEADAMAKSAFDAARGGDNAGAYKLYMEAAALYIDASDPTGAARSAYSASLSAMATGSGARALAALRTASPEDAGALRGSYALALATLSARYGATADAKSLLQKAIAASWFDDPAALADAKSLFSGL
jgi:hypothetical protein